MFMQRREQKVYFLPLTVDSCSERCLVMFKLTKGTSINIYFLMLHHNAHMGQYGLGANLQLELWFVFKCEMHGYVFVFA